MRFIPWIAGGVLGLTFVVGIAFITPDTLNLVKDARVNSMEALADAVRNAANDAHAEQLVTKTLGFKSIEVDDRRVQMIDGYPAASEGGIVMAIQPSKSFVAEYYLVDLDHQPVEASSSREQETQARVAVLFRHKSRPDDCWVEYAEAAIRYKIFTPSVRTDTTGC